jgi:hypothetical protein
MDSRQPKTGHYRRHEAGRQGRPGAKTLVKTHHATTPIEGQSRVCKPPTPNGFGAQAEVTAKAVPLA